MYYVRGFIEGVAAVAFLNHAIPWWGAVLIILTTEIFAFLVRRFYEVMMDLPEM